MAITFAENYRKAVLFDHPEWIPMTFHINPACWNHYDHSELQDLMASHPKLFPNFKPQPRVHPVYEVNQWKDHPYTDPWGCTWTTESDGITGSVTGHPLKTWGDFIHYPSPDPDKTNGLIPMDWDKLNKEMVQAKKAGGLACAGLPHGHTFLRLCDMRGYENLMFDMADEEPLLWDLISLNENFNLALIERYLRAGANFISYAEDLGMQVGPMLSPDHFRTYIKPSYQKLMAPAQKAGAVIHMHSDGDIRLLVDDMLECGIQVLNCQDLVNGLDWIADNLLGRVCIDLDIDRQLITHRGSPQDIDKLIREEVTKLARPSGGLTMIYGLYPGVPRENVKALMDAMERYMN